MEAPQVTPIYRLYVFPLISSSTTAAHRKNEGLIPFMFNYSNSVLKFFTFRVFMSNKQLLAAKAEGLLKKFKLTTSISTTNMHLLDSDGVMKKYNTPEEILEEFFRLRLDFYEKRKETMLANKENDILKCENKYGFIKGVLEGSIIICPREKADLLNELKEKGFKPLPNDWL